VVVLVAFILAGMQPILPGGRGNCRGFCCKFYFWSDVMGYRIELLQVDKPPLSGGIQV